MIGVSTHIFNATTFCYITNMILAVHFSHIWLDSLGHGQSLFQAVTTISMALSTICKNVSASYRKRASRMNDHGMKIAFFTCAFLSLIG